MIKRSLGAAGPNLSTKDRGGGLARDTGLGACPRRIRQNLRTIRDHSRQPPQASPEPPLLSALG